jgi:hypothetical protein
VALACILAAVALPRAVTFFLLGHPSQGSVAAGLAALCLTVVATIVRWGSLNIAGHLLSLGIYAVGLWLFLFPSRLQGMATPALGILPLQATFVGGLRAGLCSG